MAIVQNLCLFALKAVIGGACEATGAKAFGGSGEGLTRFLTERLTDPSQRLTKALHASAERAWKGLEVALAGETFWRQLDRAEDKAFRQQVRAFLDAAVPNDSPATDAQFVKQCLVELRAARKAGKLVAGAIDPQELARQAGHFARFSDPDAVLEVERKALAGIARAFAGEYPRLARLLELEPQPGRSLLVVGVCYFFRRAVEDDPQLFQGLAFAKLERLDEARERGFAALDNLLKQQGQRLETLLAEMQVLVAETHDAVLDLQEQMAGQGEQVRQIWQMVQKLLEPRQLQRRELRPGDSLSIRNESERQLVKEAVARYRALSEDDRKQVPALLNAIGKLEVVAGDFEAARQDFQAVAAMEKDKKAQAEAHHNAYMALLEKRDLPGAIEELVKAVKLDAKRYAPFPTGKYQPIRILGAGGFGVAFLCKHKYMDAQVVVKTLMLEDLGRDADKVFTEAQVLRQLDHPAVIRISDCGYVDAANKSRPFLVMDYFKPGMTLEEHVKKSGPMPVDDLLAVAREVAEGLRAAHGKNILHRDVKPANLLVRKDEDGWKVKVIDFGLALRQKVVQTSMNASTSKQSKSLVGESLAGTMDYAAPEQMGKREGEPTGPYSDVYGWAKTCCYALFQTTQPLLKHWRSLPAPLAELLGQCLEEDPKKRTQCFADVLTSLANLKAHAAPVATSTVEAPRTSIAPSAAKAPQSPPAAPVPTPAPTPIPTPTPLPARRPLPDPTADENYFAYLKEEPGLIAMLKRSTDLERLQGPLPRHPNNLIAECQRLALLPSFEYTEQTGWMKQVANKLAKQAAKPVRARYRTCLLALEQWAYFYPEFRGDYINLWNGTAALFEADEIRADYFRQKSVRDKYE